jgi:hypothetical protein
MENSNKNNIIQLREMLESLSEQGDVHFESEENACVDFLEGYFKQARKPKSFSSFHTDRRHYAR